MEEGEGVWDGMLRGAPEYMAHVFPALFIPAYIGEVPAIIPAHSPHTDSMDGLQ